MAYQLLEKMTAISCNGAGDSSVLQTCTLERPIAADGEVVIRTAYAGVNRPDIIQRQGLYPPPPGASPILGLEVSGEIVAIGDQVAPELLGRKVCALAPGGGYAEYCKVPAGHCLIVDDHIPLDKAAAIPETLFTVWHNVFQRGLARDGETLLVHGGTSGIGTMAIMLAKAFDLNVITTCGSDTKCAAALEIGADYAINYRTEDFAARIKDITDGKGVDIVLDMISGNYVSQNLKCLAMDGRHVTIAVLGGMQAEINMALVMSKRLTLTGSTLRPQSDDFKTLLARDIKDNVWPLFLSGELSPVMDRIYPLSEVGDAHRRMEGGDHIGKIVLKIGE